jgi:hypothetical protein
VEREAKSGELKLLSGEQTTSSAPEKYVRRLREPPKLLDLLDIVAGGNGLGNRRECGIDPTTGENHVEYPGGHRPGDYRYHKVFYHRMIDGVFIPDGSFGAVQLDSAGHVFEGFPPSDCMTFGFIWARAAKIAPENSIPGKQHWMYVIGEDKRFMPEQRGLLCMHANQAITFNLNEMRRLYRGLHPARFRAVAGLHDARCVDPKAEVLADLWVFIDGRLKFNRNRVRPEDGLLNVDVDVEPSDGFLTLAVTDGGNSHQADWAFFGDPVLELKSTNENH